MTDSLPTYKELQEARTTGLQIQDLIETRRDDDLPTAEEIAEAVAGHSLPTHDEIREVKR